MHQFDKLLHHVDESWLEFKWVVVTTKYVFFKWVQICTFTIKGVAQDAVLLHLFSFSLLGTSSLSRLDYSAPICQVVAHTCQAVTLNWVFYKLFGPICTRLSKLFMIYILNVWSKFYSKWFYFLVRREITSLKVDTVVYFSLSYSRATFPDV